MAGDWIKFDVTTPDKPEVVKMAADLGIDQDAVVGKLLRVWAWADQNTVTCNGESNGVTVTSTFLDRLTFCQGFAGAMRNAGWLSGEDGALRFPNFSRHNGKTAKERAVSNRRVAKHRAGSATGYASETDCVTAEALRNPLPEKRERREEIKAKTGAHAPSPADMFPEVDPNILRDWLAARKAKRLPLTETAAKGFRKDAERAGLSVIDAVKLCAERGWAGLSANWQGGGAKPSLNVAPTHERPGGGRKLL